MPPDVAFLQAELGVTKRQLAVANRARESLQELVNDMQTYERRLEKVAAAAKALVGALRELEVE